MSRDTTKKWISLSKEGAVEIEVRLTPRASRDSVGPVRDGSLLVRVTAPPVDDAANEHLVKLLSRLVGIGKSHVRLVSGRRSRTKRVSLTGCTVGQVRDALAQEGEP